MNKSAQYCFLAESSEVANVQLQPHFLLSKMYANISKSLWKLNLQRNLTDFHFSNFCNSRNLKEFGKNVINQLTNSQCLPTL